MVFWLLLGFAGPARAAPAVEWDAPAECPKVDAILASFSRMHLDAARTEGLEATGRVVREDDGFSLSLSLRSGRATSDLRLSAKKCDTLADAVALELALAVDAPAVLSTAGAETPRGPEPRFRTTLGLFGGVGFGALPGLAPGVRARVAFDTPAVRVELDARYFAPRSAYYADIAGPVGGRFNLAAGGLRVCSPPARLGFGVSGCAGFEAGVLRGEGVGVAETFSSNGFWGAFNAAPVLSWAFGPALTLFAEAEAEIAVTRPEFHERNLGTLFRADQAGAVFWLGAETSLLIDGPYRPAT